MLLDESVNMVMCLSLGWSGLRLLRMPLLMLIGFAGGSVPVRGLVVGRGTARFRVVRLGGPKVCKVRRSAADVHEAGDVFMHRDLSIAPLLDLRRRIKAVMNVLDSMVRKDGYAGSVGRTHCTVG